MFKVYNGEPEFEELAQEFDAGGSAMSIRGFPDVYNPKFRKIMEFLRTDKEFIRECRAHEQYYIRASTKNEFNVMDENLTDATSQISIYHKYISTPMNNTTQSLKHAIINGNHKKGHAG